MIIMSILHKDIAAIREDYSKFSLDEKEALANPITLFEKWFAEAIAAQVAEPNAMVLGSLSADGFPSSRIVLLKDIKPNGFSFFTNYKSKKALSLANHDKVSLLFFWHELQRQVRIEGIASKLPASDSDEYFASRPKASQIGAIASPQSQVILNRSVLEEQVQLLEAQYADSQVLPRPENWGGYLIEPSYMEFWQGRSSRLHDRLAYKQEAGEWEINRLAP